MRSALLGESWPGSGASSALNSPLGVVDREVGGTWPRCRGAGLGGEAGGGLLGGAAPERGLRALDSLRVAISSSSSSSASSPASSPTETLSSWVTGMLLLVLVLVVVLVVLVVLVSVVLSSAGSGAGVVRGGACPSEEVGEKGWGANLTPYCEKAPPTLDGTWPVGSPPAKKKIVCNNK